MCRRSRLVIMGTVQRSPVHTAFNLIPTLSAMENITLPMDLAGVKPDEAWPEQIIAPTTASLA